MPNPKYFNDSPITSPTEDRFGIDPFARALATSFADLASPIGSTIAINGPWGSGKSSAINLIRHHLAKKENLVIIDFRCWWFRGDEALTVAFLQTLYAALEKGLCEQAKDLIPKIGKKLLQAGSVLAPVVDLVSPVGALVAGGLDFANRFFSDSDSIESLFERLSEALAREDKRYLVVIDDIDRLTPDEAILIFRLVKSVGRLPNVMYLLAFDRELAEKAIKDRYPSEGPHFLEKIIQANFEVPLPGRDELNNAVLTEIERLCGAPTDSEAIATDSEALVRFMNIFYEGVAPYLNTPRDVARLVNAIAVTWPPVKGEVDLADFIALEAMRVFEPSLYTTIRSNKENICGVKADYGRREDTAKLLESLVALVPENRRTQAKDALQILFPRLQNIAYGSHSLDSWRAQRLICTKEHFDTYFRLAIGDETLPSSEIKELIERAGDAEYVKAVFVQALNSIRKNGKSKVPLLFEELNAYAKRVADANLQTFVSSIFEIADDIDREGDRERAFGIGDNHLRIHWLIRKLTFERCDLKRRSDIFVKACENAQLGWLVDFANSAITDYFPREGKQPEPPENCLIEKDRVDELRAYTLRAITDAARTGKLIHHPRLSYILFRWREFAENDDSVRAWVNEQLTDDVAVAILAKAFTSESWSHRMGTFGLGDRVAIRRITASIAGLDLIMDVGLFRRRLEELDRAGTLAEPYKSYVGNFLGAWRSVEEGEDWD